VNALANSLRNKDKGDDETMIEIKGLTKVYGTLHAVDDMDLSCYKNEVLALLGHNGAGKTTTISMITGMQAPTAGDVIVNGNSIVTNVD
jgi:ABC-type multidrug transport system ATPase subunit